MLKKISINTVLAISLLLIWYLVFHQSILSAIKIWSISEIYAHGFFVVPAMAYFIWAKRSDILVVDPSPNYWVLILISGMLFLNVLGIAGDINIFQHVSAFFSLSLSIWFFWGNLRAKKIMFPLFFVVFAIPVGEELIPVMQEVTADLALFLLKFTGLPVFRNGLYIEIPAGQFVVAEACSGIRFFIGSIVFGAVYAYVSFEQYRLRAIFMCISIVVPIVANAVRVFGIIMVGHFSQMKHAVGADHLIYGWVFFSIVIILLVCVGEWLRRKDSAFLTASSSRSKFSLSGIMLSITEKDIYKYMDYKSNSKNFIAPTFLYITLFGLVGLWQWHINDSADIKSLVPDNSVTQVAPKILSLRKNFHSLYSYDDNWTPLFNNPLTENKGQFILTSDQDTEFGIDVYVAQYDAYDRTDNSDDNVSHKAELISGLNRFYEPTQWTLNSAKVKNILVDSFYADILSKSALEKKIDVQLLSVTSATKKNRWILYWYELGKNKTGSAGKAKIYQIMNRLLGNVTVDKVVVLSVIFEEAEKDEQLEKLLNFIRLN